MERSILNIDARCSCGGMRLLGSIQMDPVGCDYILVTQCIVCKEYFKIYLGIEEFILLPSNLNLYIPPEPDLLGEGQEN